MEENRPTVCIHDKGNWWSSRETGPLYKNSHAAVNSYKPMETVWTINGHIACNERYKNERQKKNFLWQLVEICQTRHSFYLDLYNRWWHEDCMVQL